MCYKALNVTPSVRHYILLKVQILLVFEDYRFIYFFVKQLNSWNVNLHVARGTI